MKRLDINGFYSMSTKVVSKQFLIEGVDTIKELYTIKLRTNKTSYRMDIIREATDTTNSGYQYQMWLYDWNKRESYPMSIYTTDLRSLDFFTQFLENVLAIADKGDFDGHKGDWRFKQYNL